MSKVNVAPLAGHVPGSDRVVEAVEPLLVYDRLQADPDLLRADEHALDLDVVDPESVRVILDYRADRPVDLFPLDGHLHLQGVRVETTDVAAYNALRTGVAS